MASESNVYIAGVGHTPLPSDESTNNTTSLISAVTKAFLDAGVTYDDVVEAVRSKTLSKGDEVFASFSARSVPVTEIESGSGLAQSYNLIKNRGVHCVLAVTVEKSTAIALVLISDDFLWRRPYLKDSSALIRESNDQQLKPTERAYDICQSVWSLRGWSRQKSQGKVQNLSPHKEQKQTFELSRADAREIPEWKDVQYQHDGKHRLGYNPASETRDISQEDFEAVRGLGISQDRGRDPAQFKRRGGDRAAIELARL